MSGAIYNEYLTGTEREDAVLECAMEAAMAKCETAFTMVEATLLVNRKEAELKVFSESGTYDDLGMLYEAAEAEAAEKKGGIISTVVGKIVSFFQGIVDKIKAKINAGKDDEDVKVDKGDMEHMGKVRQQLEKIKTGVNKILNGQIAAGLKDLSAILAIIAVAAVATGTFIVVKRKKVREDSEACNTTAEWIKNAFSSAKEKLAAKFKTNGEEGGLFSKVGTVITKIGTEIQKAVAKVLGGVANAAKGVANAAAGVVGKGEKNDGGKTSTSTGSDYVKTMTKGDEEYVFDVPHKQIRVKKGDGAFTTIGVKNVPNDVRKAYEDFTDKVKAQMHGKTKTESVDSAMEAFELENPGFSAYVVESEGLIGIVRKGENVDMFSESFFDADDSIYDESAIDAELAELDKLVDEL